MAKRQKPKTRTTAQHKTPHQKAPFIEHIQEFRKRLVWVAISVVGFSVAGYFIQEQLINLLLRPASDQQFIYTTPGGGINFLLQVCLYFGISISIPVIVYQLLRFVEPLFRRTERSFIFKSTLFSAILALSGMAFGYFIGLPAALHFLSNQSLNSHIQALLSVSDYLSFVTIYLAGAAVMFQLPLILLLINRITPLKPSKLLKSEKWVVLAAFIMAAIITPTPDLINQSIIAGPIILTYQLGVIAVWLTNMRSNRQVVSGLSANDKQAQAVRIETARDASAIAIASVVYPLIPLHLEPVHVPTATEYIPVTIHNPPSAVPTVIEEPSEEPIIEHIEVVPAAAPPEPITFTPDPSVIPARRKEYFFEVPAPEPEPVIEPLVEPVIAPPHPSVIPGRRVDRIFDDPEFALSLTAAVAVAEEQAEAVLKQAKNAANRPPTSRFQTA